MKVIIGEKIILAEDKRMKEAPIRDKEKKLRYDCVNSPDGNIFILYLDHRLTNNYLMLIYI